MSGSLVSGLLVMENSSSSSTLELTTERVTVKVLQGKKYVKKHQVKHGMSSRRYAVRMLAEISIIVNLWM